MAALIFSGRVKSDIDQYTQVFKDSLNNEDRFDALIADYFYVIASPRFRKIVPRLNEHLQSEALLERFVPSIEFQDSFFDGPRSNSGKRVT